MTLEDFAHRCLMIKAGNATLDIPCCANCKYYNKKLTNLYLQTTDSFPGIRFEGKYEWICDHPETDSDDSAVCWLNMKPEDFCSRWESRNE